MDRETEIIIFNMISVKGDKKMKERIKEQLVELNSVYPELKSDIRFDGVWLVTGILKMNATYKGINFRDEFLIEIVIPENYPDELPEVREISDKITEYKNSDKILGLGTHLEMRLIFFKNPTLLNFVDNILVPFLYGSLYNKTNQIMPFGALSYGGSGLWEYYREYFNIFDDDDKILKFIKVMASKRVYKYCPCGCKKKIENCPNGLKILEAKKVMQPADFKKELKLIRGD